MGVRALFPHLGVLFWIAIDRKEIEDRFVSANDLVEQWESTGSYGHKIMPRLEAACIGSVPVGHSSEHSVSAKTTIRFDR